MTWVSEGGDVDDSARAFHSAGGGQPWALDVVKHSRDCDGRRGANSL